MTPGHSSGKRSVLRCGPIEINLTDAEVRRHGIRIKLQEKPFQLLVTLLERQGGVVTREELRARLWADNTYVDFERSLNVAVSKLRTALGEEPENPRYVETVRGRGYRFIAPVHEEKGEVNGQSPGHENHTRLQPDSPEHVRRRFGARRAAITVCGLLSAAAAYFALRPASQPKVLEYVQITQDGNPKQGPLLADGLHVYFVEQSGGHRVLARVPVTGGETAAVLTLDDKKVTAFSRVGPEALVLLAGSDTVSPLYVCSLASGSLRRLGDLRAQFATWSPDGETVLYASENAVFTAKSDGTQSRKLMDLPFKAGQLSWSPDGRLLEVEAFGGGIWEFTSDGKNLHPLPVVQPGDTAVGIGDWNRDGRYYFFSMLRRGRGDLWALRRSGRTPVRLTTGQLNLTDPVTSSDGRKLFALGALKRAEFVRYDPVSGSFSPYLPGVSAGALAFSQDQAWIAYTAYPGRTLWRCRADGSERVQLTFAPNQTAMPRWSPDGKRIAFMSRPPDGRWKIYEIAPSGGTAEQLVPGDEDAGNPTWSPDGRTLAFAGTPWVQRFALHSTVIHVLDLNTRKMETLPGTEGLWAPRWSPDGKFLVAETLDSRGLMTYEFSTQKWTRLATAVNEMIGYSSWSNDSKFVYYNAYSIGTGRIFRVSIRSRQPELVVALKDLDEAEPLGRFFTLAANDTPVVLRDTSIGEIYSLNVHLP